MSDTPRTDAAVFAPVGMIADHDGFSAPIKNLVHADLARQLEKELHDTQIKHDVLLVRIMELSQERDRLRQEIEALKNWKQFCSTSARQGDVANVILERDQLRAELQSAIYNEGCKERDNDQLRAEVERLTQFCKSTVAGGAEMMKRCGQWKDMSEKQHAALEFIKSNTVHDEDNVPCGCIVCQTIDAYKELLKSNQDDNKKKKAHTAPS